MMVQMVPDLPYPENVTGTQKPPDQPLEEWFRQKFANRARLAALSVVRIGARHYGLTPTMRATGIAYAAWTSNGRIEAEIYPFHEAAESNDDGHNFFWKGFGEEENLLFFAEFCPLEVLQQLTPAATADAYMWRRECARNFPAHVFPQLHQQLQLVFPAEGTSWRLRTTLQPNPFLLAEAGLEGVIEEANEDLISLQFVQPLPGAEDWENCLHWYPDNSNGAVLWDFLRDCEPIPTENVEESVEPAR